jgi:hypothetical protein
MSASTANAVNSAVLCEGVDNWRADDIFHGLNAHHELIPVNISHRASASPEYAWSVLHRLGVDGLIVPIPRSIQDIPERGRLGHTNRDTPYLPPVGPRKFHFFEEKILHRDGSSTCLMNPTAAATASFTSTIP